MSFNKTPLNNYSNPFDKYSEQDHEYNDMEFQIDTVPLEKDDPFHDTDLLVFRDNYEGILPLNGIKESNFNLIKEKYQEFLKGKTKFEIEKDKAFENLITDP